MKKFRVLLDDDHQMLRDGLKLLVNHHPRMQVVGEAGNGREALEKALELRPDVVVMDLSMPEMDGLKAAERLKEEMPEVKIVALTLHEEEAYMRALYEAGAAGYVLKRSAGRELITAIEKVATGGTCFDASLVSKALMARSAGAENAETGRGELSAREKEVLTFLAWGHSSKEIALALKLSIKTVETYKRRLGEKLQLRSRAEMVKYAMSRGWMSAPRA